MRPEEEIGLELQEKREALGLSVEEIVQETKIQSKYIRAIEKGDFHIIPGEVYVHGFIKSYAKLLGMDGKDLIAKLPTDGMEQGGMSSAPEGSETRFSERPSHDPDRYPDHLPSRRMKSGSSPSAGHRQSIFQIIRVAVIIIALLFGLYYVYENVILQNLPDPIENGSALDPVDPDEPGPEDPQEPDPIPPEIMIISDTAGNAVVEVKAPVLELTVEATGRCWLRVQTDDAPPESQTLEPGDEVSFTAETEILMRAGNSGGINIYISGELLEVSGRSGGVKNYTITRLP